MGHVDDGRADRAVCSDHYRGLFSRGVAGQAGVQWTE